MRRLSIFRLGVVFTTLGLLTVPSHAFINFKKLWPFGKQAVAPAKPKERVAGHQVRIFRLEKGRVGDLLPALQNHLNGIHSQGDLFSDAAANSFVATDSPENLQRLAYLIKEMDKTCDNSNARARQVLAAETLMKALRGLAASGGLPRPPSVPSSSVAASPQPEAVVGSQAPVSGSLPSGLPAPREEETTRIIEERPILQAFQLVGWVRDRAGYIVVLRNQGQRYIFRHGHIRYKSLNNPDTVKGVSGAVRGDRLILSDPQQGVLSLSMIKPPDGARSPK